ncbi:MAG: TIGR00303 family protein [Prochloron sp. SP5CPC1]|nr:TIGR00303 family protein [Candidatus Paraprochloron terpiosi SP5CPC1]
MINVYTAEKKGRDWLDLYGGQKPLFACILGFTATGLIPGISAAGATPADRQYTAIADAEFLLNGPAPNPVYPLPPLEAGASPVLISRAVVEAFQLPVYLFNAGLPHAPAVETMDLGGIPANCVSTGKALPLKTVERLLGVGLDWGAKLAKLAPYIIIGECVVGGTTTALGVLTGLGITRAKGKVNSSHPRCNHAQKWAVVQTGLCRAPCHDPLEVVAAVGDPMQVVAAGMAIAASVRAGVMLAGGTQMLAVFALLRAIALKYRLDAQLERLVVGTTPWVVEDTTGDTVGLARDISEVPLLAAPLSFAPSRYPSLRAYEEGYVKEGVGAGGAAIAAHLYGGWSPLQLLIAVEALISRMNPTS